MPKKGTTKYLSDRQEKEVAEEINGKQVIASGALWSMKADVRNDRLLVECKITEKEYYRLTLATWKKIEEQAVKDSIRYPLMCIDVKVKGVFYRYAVFDPYEIGYPPFDVSVFSSKYRERELFKDFHGYPIEKGVKSIKVPNGIFDRCLYYAYDYRPVWTLLVIPWEEFKEFAEKKGLLENGTQRLNEKREKFRIRCEVLG